MSSSDYASMDTDAQAADPADASPPIEVARARRPQWLTLMLMGDFAFERPIALSTGTFLEVLADLGIGPHTTRSTLQRMCDRGLLARYRKGREVYFGLTDRSTALLRRGQTQSWRPVDPEWDGTWTLLAFSIPEERRPVRQRLRSRLGWAGFGLLQSGLWIAPGDVDVAPLVADLDVFDDIKTFRGGPSGTTTVESLIREAYDIDALAQRYHGFLDRWSDPASQHPTELASLLLMQGEWQQIAQSDPRLPLRHLPPEWPADRADKLFRSRFDTWKPLAQHRITAHARILDLDAA